MLTDDQEDTAAEWVLSHPEFYDKGHSMYKETTRKEKLWADKAVVFGVTTETLKVWYTSMRTRYGKVTKDKSGDGASDLTERDAWIVRRFSFLAGHIKRVDRRQGVSIKKKIAASQPAEEGDSDASTQGSQDTQDTLDTQDDEPPVDKAPKSKKRRSEDEAIKKLLSRIDQSKKVQEALTMKAAEVTKAKPAASPWAEWMVQQVSRIHPSMMDRFNRESFDLITRYTAESARLTDLEKQQQQQFAVPHSSTTSGYQTQPYTMASQLGPMTSQLGQMSSQLGPMPGPSMPCQQFPPPMEASWTC